MTMPALTPAGLVVPSATETKADLDAAFKGIYGDSIGSDSDGSIPAASSIGQEVGILVDGFSGRDELLSAVYAGWDPGQAKTPQLQILCGITGTRQKDALASTVRAACKGTAGTVLLAGRVATVTGTGARFVSQADATLALVTATWAALTPYAVYDMIINGGWLWICIVAGTSSAGSPPTGGGTHTEGSVTWEALASATVAVALVDFAAESTGPIGASHDTLLTIATPVFGWVAIQNPLAATLGRDVESEPALRARRVAELQGQGGGPADSIRARILAVPGVQECKVFVNTSDVVDGDGVPAHGIEVLIQAPSTAPTDDQSLAQLVWSAAGGITLGGTITKTVTDASKNPQTVKFSRPGLVPIYASLTVFYDASQWPGGGPAVQAAAKSALMTYGAGLAIGVDVRSSQLAGAVEDGPVSVAADGLTPQVAELGAASAPGILGVANGTGSDGTLPFIGLNPAPVSSSTLAMDLRHIADLSDPTKFVITATPALP